VHNTRRLTAGRESHCMKLTTLLFSAEIKNAWRCTSTSPYMFMARCVSTPIVVSYRIRNKSVGVFCSGDNFTLDIHVSVHHDIIYENDQQGATV